VGVAKICPTAVPLDEVKQMVHDAFFRHVSRPSYLITQIAKTLKSSYRMNVMINNLSRIVEIREGANAVT